MSAFLIVIITTTIIGIPASIIAYLLLLLGRRVAGIAGMKAAAVVAVSISAVPLFWAMMQYCRIWMAGMSLRPQHGDQYFGYVLLVAFIFAPIVVVCLLRWLWSRHLPTAP